MSTMAFSTVVLCFFVGFDAIAGAAVGSNDSSSSLNTTHTSSMTSSGSASFASTEQTHTTIRPLGSATSNQADTRATDPSRQPNQSGSSQSVPYDLKSPANPHWNAFLGQVASQSSRDLADLQAKGHNEPGLAAMWEIYIQTIVDESGVPTGSESGTHGSGWPHHPSERPGWFQSFFNVSNNDHNAEHNVGNDLLDAFMMHSPPEPPQVNSTISNSNDTSNTTSQVEDAQKHVSSALYSSSSTLSPSSISDSMAKMFSQFSGSTFNQQQQQTHELQQHHGHEKQEQQLLQQKHQQPQQQILQPNIRPIIEQVIKGTLQKQQRLRQHQQNQQQQQVQRNQQNGSPALRHQYSSKASRFINNFLSSTLSKSLTPRVSAPSPSPPIKSQTSRNSQFFGQSHIPRNSQGSGMVHTSRNSHFPGMSHTPQTYPQPSHFAGNVHRIPVTSHVSRSPQTQGMFRNAPTSMSWENAGQQESSWSSSPHGWNPGYTAELEPQYEPSYL